MDSRTSWCLWLLAQQPKPPPADNLFVQEDEETRRMIAHYLHLADRLLSSEPTEVQEEGQNTAA
jgi:hypothetical protein